MELTPYEKETIVNFNESSDYATIYTASRRVYNHLIKGGLKPLEILEGGWVFKVDKRTIRIKVDKHSIYIGGLRSKEVIG